MFAEATKQQGGFIWWKPLHRRVALHGIDRLPPWLGCTYLPYMHFKTVTFTWRIRDALITVRQRKLFSVVPVCNFVHWGRGFPAQGPVPSPPPAQGHSPAIPPCTGHRPWSPPPYMFKPHCTPPLLSRHVQICSKHGMSESGRLAFDWNAFLFGVNVDDFRSRARYLATILTYI